MPRGLPPVLITTETITEEIDNTDRVQVEDVAKLWKVYALNRTHIEDDASARLENFFWRIWSNPNIIRSIRGNNLARMFISISQGGNRVRTTPVQSPFSTAPPSTFPLSASPRKNVGDISPHSGDQLIADVGDASRRTSDQSRTLPPILKKARLGSDDAPMSARIPSSSAEGRELPRTGVRRDSENSTGCPLSPSGPTEKVSKNAGKKRTSFTGAIGNRKARPGAMRKKSSQSSASGEQRKGSQTSPSPGLLPSKTTPKSAMGLPRLITATFALPSDSWQDVESPVSSRETIDTALSTVQQPSSWLVDKNFRGRFVEHQQRSTSAINLAALSKTQSVRFLDEMPEHKGVGGKGRSRVDKVTPTNILAAEVAEQGPAFAASAASETEDDDNRPALARTKSHLSMLIDKVRKEGSTNFGAEATKQGYGNGQNTSKNNHDDEQENELLVMARREKKGRSQDPDHPFKAAAKKGLWKGGSSGDDDLGGSRSPPPLF